MKFLLVLVLFQGLIVANGLLANPAAKPRSTPCNTPTLKNGLVRIRSKGKLARFICNMDYTLHGTATSMCTNGRWEGDIPMCVAPGCTEIASPANATLLYVKRRSALKLTCDSRYELVGNAESFCDGIEWDRTIGKCRETNITSPVFCDFEGRLKCGWSNYLLNEKDWLRTNMGRHGIGPQHDHTKVAKYEGFFMLLEGNSPRYAVSSYLFSPMYDADVSNNSCFKFYYHMYGVVTGSIRVFVKTAKQTDANFFSSLRKSALLEIANRSSNAWIEALVRLPKLGDNFQIVIQGVIMRGQRTDLAIDDVEILDAAACEADKAVATVKPEDEAGGVYDVQSCENRCDAKPGNDSVLGNILKCDCFEGCEDEDTCCPDYDRFCVFGETTTITTTTIVILPPTTSTPRLPTPKTTTTTTTTTVVPTPRKTTVKPKQKQTTEGTDVLEFDFTTVQYMNDDYKTVEIVSNMDDKTDMEHITQVAEQVRIPSWLIGTGVLFSIMMITLGGFYVYRDRTRVSTPTEIKKKYHCKSANEEFSEIRFLTEDEQLDFTLATPMDD